MNQLTVDSSGLLITRPNSFAPAVDIVQDNALYTIIMDVPGVTSEDIRLSRQNVTTIVKGTRLRPYAELLVHKVDCMLIACRLPPSSGMPSSLSTRLSGRSASTATSR